MPVIRLEYIDTAMEKASDEEQIAALRSIRDVAARLLSVEASAAEQCVKNRVDAGESPKKMEAPQWASQSSEVAEAEIHRLESRKCRRATRSTDIIASLEQLITSDIENWIELAKYVELPANAAVLRNVLEVKQTLQREIRAFLERWKSVP